MADAVVALEAQQADVDPVALRPGPARVPPARGRSACVFGKDRLHPLRMARAPLGGPARATCWREWRFAGHGRRHWRPSGGNITGTLPWVDPLHGSVSGNSAVHSGGFSLRAVRCGGRNGRSLRKTDVRYLTFRLGTFCRGVAPSRPPPIDQKDGTQHSILGCAPGYPQFIHRDGGNFAGGCIVARGSIIPPRLSASPRLLAARRFFP